MKPLVLPGGAVIDLEQLREGGFIYYLPPKEGRMSRVFGWILGIGTFAGAVYLWWSKRNDIGDLKTALEVQSIRERVAAREASLQDKIADASVSAAHIETLQGIITDQKAEALKLASRASLEGKSDAEIALLFTNSLL